MAAASSAGPQPPLLPAAGHSRPPPKPAHLLWLRLKVPACTVGHFQTNEAMTRRRRVAAHGASGETPPPRSRRAAWDPGRQLPHRTQGPDGRLPLKQASPRCPRNGTLSRGASSRRWGQQGALDPGWPSVRRRSGRRAQQPLFGNQEVPGKRQSQICLWRDNVNGHLQDQENRKAI